jgi:hypothetical protein
MIDTFHLDAMRQSDPRAWFLEVERRCLEHEAILAAQWDEYWRARHPVRDFASERLAVLEQAPKDLRALGVPLPATAWNLAVEELHRQEAMEIALQAVVMRHASLLWLATRVWEDRGKPGYGPGLVDVAEAELQIGETRAEIAAENARLHRKAMRGEWP